MAMGTMLSVLAAIILPQFAPVMCVSFKPAIRSGIVVRRSSLR